MLKARVEAGEDLDRGVEIIARSIGRLLEAGSKSGMARIQAYPSLDSLVAASVLHKVSRSLGVGTSISVSVRPQPAEEPSILLGFNSLGLKSWEVGDQLLAISSGQVKGSPPPGAVYVEVEGSVSSAIGLGLLEHRTPARDLLPLLAASYSTKYVDQAGRFHGVDRVLLEALADQAGLDMYTGVKAYNPHKWPAWRSLSSTCNPYLVGLTGRPDAARELLSSLGIDPERSLGGLVQEEVEKLASTILEAMGRGGGIEAVKILGGVVVSKDPIIADLRMASDILYMAGELGGVGGLAGLVLDLDNEYPIASALLESSCTAMQGIVDDVGPLRVKIAPWIRAYKVPAQGRPGPTLLWRAFELLGRVERESVILVELGGRLAASALQVESASPGSARRLVDNKVARLEGLWLVFDVEGEQV